MGGFLNGMERERECVSVCWGGFCVTLALGLFGLGSIEPATGPGGPERAAMSSLDYFDASRL